MNREDGNAVEVLESAYHALVQLGGQGIRRADRMAADMLALIDALEAIEWFDEDQEDHEDGPTGRDGHGHAPALDSSTAPR